MKHGSKDGSYCIDDLASHADQCNKNHGKLRCANCWCLYKGWDHTKISRHEANCKGGDTESNRSYLEEIRLILLLFGIKDNATGLSLSSSAKTLSEESKKDIRKRWDNLDEKTKEGKEETLNRILKNNPRQRDNWLRKKLIHNTGRKGGEAVSVDVWMLFQLEEMGLGDKCKFEKNAIEYYEMGEG